MHALQFTCSKVVNQNYIQAALWRLIDDEQEWYMGEALPEWRAENEIIVLRTLLRREAYVRADCQPYDDLPALLESNDLARECLQHFNYRMSGGRFRHYCAGCCLCLDDVKAKSFSLMLRADATLANDSNQATLDNWETAGLACGKLALAHWRIRRYLAVFYGHCQIGRRASELAFRSTIPRV